MVVPAPRLHAALVLALLGTGCDVDFERVVEEAKERERRGEAADAGTEPSSDSDSDDFGIDAPTLPSTPKPPGIP